MGILLGTPGPWILIIFSEIDVDKVSRITGMDITFVTTAKTDLEAYELLKSFGLPFVKRQEVIQ